MKKLLGIETPEDTVKKLQEDYVKSTNVPSTVVNNEDITLLLNEIVSLNNKINSSNNTINALSELIITMSEQQTKMQAEQKAQSELLFTVYMIFEEMAAATASITSGSVTAPKKKNITDLAEIKPVTSPPKGNKQSN